MKIKRFFAPEMREAIKQVKDELGADAVILSNNKVDGGIELVAAIDYDEDAVHRSLNHNSNNNSADIRSTRQQSMNQQNVNQKPKAVIQDRKKRPVLAKAKKQKMAEKLEDSIQDDVISFSNHRAVTQNQEAVTQHVQAQGFSELLKQTTSNQSSRLDHGVTNAHSKPSLQDRKQPYISDFSSYEDEFESDDVATEDESAFDYESLLGLEKQRVQRNEASDMDDFFSDNVQQPGKRSQMNTHSSKQNKNDTRRSGNKTKIEWAQEPALVSMNEEIKSLRGILENQLSGLAWGDFARRHPHRAELLSRLYRLGIKSSLSEKIVKQLKSDHSLEDNWRRLLSIISRNIPTMDHDLVDEGGIIALVGPTGVGKTTSIAKMAARYTLKHGAKNLALVTTDSYRVGAHEQLKTYGRILGVTVYVANDEDELKLLLSRLDDKQLILIDTAGMSHRDLRLAQQLAMLRRSHEKMKILAVLSAASQTLAMDDVIKTFDAKQLDGCIASKVDESTSMGGIISILIENKLQLNYISDGQKVPEDIHLANATDLLKEALGMVKQHPMQVKTDELAMSYSGEAMTRAVS